MSLSDEAKSDPSLVSRGSPAGSGLPWATIYPGDSFDMGPDGVLVWMTGGRATLHRANQAIERQHHLDRLAADARASEIASQGILTDDEVRAIWTPKNEPVGANVTDPADEIHQETMRIDYTPEDIASANATARFLASMGSPRDKPRPAVTQLMRDYWGIRDSGKVTHHEAIGLLRVLRDSR